MGIDFYVGFLANDQSTTVYMSPSILAGRCASGIALQAMCAALVCTPSYAKQLLDLHNSILHLYTHEPNSQLDYYVYKAEQAFLEDNPTYKAFYKTCSAYNPQLYAWACQFGLIVNQDGETTDRNAILNYLHYVLGLSYEVAKDVARYVHKIYWG